jgi:hypothetical protein
MICTEFHILRCVYISDALKPHTKLKKSCTCLGHLGKWSPKIIRYVGVALPKVVSISPIFYEHLFHTKVFCAAFMWLQFGFVIFWQKDLGAKAAHKMLVKLTPGQVEQPMHSQVCMRFCRKRRLC